MPVGVSMFLDCVILDFKAVKLDSEWKNMLEQGYCLKRPRE